VKNVQKKLSSCQEWNPGPLTTAASTLPLSHGNPRLYSVSLLLPLYLHLILSTDRLFCFTFTLFTKACCEIFSPAKFVTRSEKTNHF